MTPHQGGAARLLKATAQQIQSDRVQALRELSKRHDGCWAALKGHQTLIGQAAVRFS